MFLSQVCSIHPSTNILNCNYEKLAYNILYKNKPSLELIILFAVNEKYVSDGYELGNFTQNARSLFLFFFFKL